ncbi:hypothetical protein BN1723_013011, partial [Verticillium longisporum]
MQSLTSFLVRSNHILASASRLSSSLLTAHRSHADDPYLSTDTACAVKDDLLLDFKPLTGDRNGAVLDCEYNVTLASKKYKPEMTMLMGNANQDNF